MDGVVAAAAAAAAAEVDAIRFGLVVRASVLVNNESINQPDHQ